ncbi:MAG: nucleotidyltransferase family protein [Alphaproteobacteria bacterium]|nr:nucleotidyltransferase family protein [Alphaproteobacteria bacterium]
MTSDLTSPLIDLIQSDAAMLTALQAVRALDLPDGWISAGFVRNRVWDHLHGFDEATPLNDIDVIVFDPVRLDDAHEKRLEAELCRLRPGLPWQVKNQVRMAERNDDRPYRSIDDALEHWCETPTAIGVRLDSKERIEITAPLGLGDLFDLVVKPTPFARNHPHKLAQYRERMIKKNWPRTWPRIRVLGL